MIPLSTPVFASLGFMTLVAKWNDYTTSMIYIRDDSLYTLQYLLQRILNKRTSPRGGVFFAVRCREIPSQPQKKAGARAPAPEKVLF